MTQVQAQLLPDSASKQEQRDALIQVLIAKRDEYVDRLDTGAAKIEEARAQGKDVSEWEDFWISLLRRYEEVCDKLKNLWATDVPAAAEMEVAGENDGW